MEEVMDNTQVSKSREGLRLFCALDAMKAHCDIMAPVFLEDRRTLSATDVVRFFGH
ncbi:Hypothetical protein SMAX5B_001373 [Scophthalmus maximus]|uniref:Uncharacterized protein n=1 Tax=Scophthalmus maximus TaxID=52904 RepID=A0A2U9CQ81_SCOMX|nr:Hypothetical protein SMAX5B_001373 [Scophthalmus maximus]